MYHAPAPLDAEPLDSAAADPTGTSFFEGGSEKLRDAHLHNGQVEARAMFAPFFAISAIAAAGMCAWAMWGSVDVKLLIGWFAAVLLVNIISYRRVTSAASLGVGKV